MKKSYLLFLMIVMFLFGCDSSKTNFEIYEVPHKVEPNAVQDPELYTGITYSGSFNGTIIGIILGIETYQGDEIGQYIEYLVPKVDEENIYYYFPNITYDTFSYSFTNYNDSFCLNYSLSEYESYTLLMYSKKTTMEIDDFSQVSFSEISYSSYGVEAYFSLSFEDEIILDCKLINNSKKIETSVAEAFFNDISSKLTDIVVIKGV